MTNKNLGKKLNLAVLCGGQSAEHEVSIESAKNVVAALDKNRYQIFVIYITQSGEWILLDSLAILLQNPQMQVLTEPVMGERLFLRLGVDHPFAYWSENNLPPHTIPIDVIFPVLHGVHGEDGTLQGLLELINIPYVGAGTLGSAVCMDKEITKQILSAAGIPIAPWMLMRREEMAKISFAHVVEKLGLPLFVKPANTGSSVGVSKVKDEAQYAEALAKAWCYDDKIILEQFIPGREIECAVLGNETVAASIPGEIISHHEFYSYEAKYLDPNGADLQIPAELPAPVMTQVQTLAKKAFTLLNCAGMARVDFFVDPSGKVILNEANTIPGFTQISMYPKMWMASGMTYAELIDELIRLALERFKQQRVLVSQSHVAERMGC